MTSFTSLLLRANFGHEFSCVFSMTPLGVDLVSRELPMTYDSIADSFRYA